MLCLSPSSLHQLILQRGSRGLLQVPPPSGLQSRRWALLLSWLIWVYGENSRTVFLYAPEAFMIKLWGRQ